MSHGSFTRGATREIWLAVRGFSTRVPAARTQLRDLERCLGVAGLSGADVYYRTRTDTALVRLRADSALLEKQHLARVGRRASRASISILDPSAAGGDTQSRLSRSYMCTYDVRFLAMRSAAEGVAMLAECLGAMPASARGDAEATDAPALGLRFRRGDCWRLGRVRSLTLESIAVAAECPPRKDDHLELQLTAGSLQVALSARVLAVTPAEAARIIGAYGFGARFVSLDGRSKDGLRRMLALAEEQHALVDRPPARTHPRYSVHWPIELGIDGPDTLVPALDISQRGMFVAYGTPVPPGTPLGVTIPSELYGDRFRAGARVARVLGPRQAAVRRLAPGFGLELTSMEPHTAERFALLVDRVARRAARCVLVGASPQRLPRLTAALSAVGYGVSGVSDLDSLLGRASTRGPAADFAVLDWSIRDESPGGLALARRHLERRGTPSVVLRDNRPSDAWRLADEALLGPRAGD